MLHCGLLCVLLCCALCLGHHPPFFCVKNPNCVSSCPISSVFVPRKPSLSPHWVFIDLRGALIEIYLYRNLFVSSPLKGAASFQVTPNQSRPRYLLLLKRPEPFLEGSRGISVMVQWLRLCTQWRGPRV